MNKETVLLTGRKAANDLNAYICEKDRICAICQTNIPCRDNAFMKIQVWYINKFS